jgi:hypothetical protein
VLRSPVVHLRLRANSANLTSAGCHLFLNNAENLKRVAGGL